VRTAAVLLVAVVVWAGCGGDGGPSHAEWARDAEAICAEYQRRFDALATADTLPELARVLDRAVVLLEEGTDKLRALRPPDEDERLVGRMLAQMDRVTEATKQARAAARRRDTQGVDRTIAEGDSANSQASTLARDLGIPTCARS
jgi:hypothetical protein